MTERIAILSIAVTLDASGNVTQVTHVTNTPDLKFWRRVVDALYLEQERKMMWPKARGENSAEQENN